MLEAAICFHLNIGLVGIILISRWPHHITYTFVVMWFVSLYPMFQCAPPFPYVLSTTRVIKYKYIQFLENVLKSTFEMYLSTMRSTFQLPIIFCTQGIK